MLAATVPSSRRSGSPKASARSWLSIPIKPSRRSPANIGTQTAQRAWSVPCIATMPHFAKTLSGSTSKPVIDDTGLEGEYSLDLEWKYKWKDDSALGPVLAAQGLRLVPGRRKVEFLRVETVKKK